MLELTTKDGTKVWIKTNFHGPVLKEVHITPKDQDTRVLNLNESDVDDLLHMLRS